MDFLTGNNDLGTLGLGLIIAGAAAGLFSGVMGRGAGFVLVPALYSALASAGVAPDLRLHVAIGTALAALVPNAVAAAFAGARYRAVDADTVKAWTPVLIAGSAIGAVLAMHLPGATLALLFALAAVAVAAGALLDKQFRLSLPCPLAALLPALVGGFSALLGLSGTSFAIPALASRGLEKEKAASTAAVLSLFVTVIGMAVAIISGWNASGLPPTSIGYANLLGWMILSPVMVASATLARHYAHGQPTKNLRFLFAVVVIVPTAKMLWDVLG